MPDPLPVLLLGRLAIDRRHHRQGLGRALLRDALLRAVHVASDAGVFAVMVHALSERARRFYLSCGFVESPLQPRTLIMTLATVRATLAEPVWPHGGRLHYDEDKPIDRLCRRRVGGKAACRFPAKAARRQAAACDRRSRPVDKSLASNVYLLVY